jgi:hypothetical protein
MVVAGKMCFSAVAMSVFKPTEKRPMVMTSISTTMAFPALEFHPPTEYWGLETTTPDQVFLC